MKKDTIFVSIASYRDKLCNNTIINLYNNAKFPENIYLGIVQQNKEDDLDCLHNIYNPRIKIIRLSYLDAKGPTYARYLCSKLWDNEEYFFQIDAHTKFVKDWDIKCITAIKNIKRLGLSNKPVLSHYPRSINDYIIPSYKKFVVTYIKNVFFNKYGIIKYDGAGFINTNNTFIKTPFVTGCMLFTESKFLKDIPFDPNLDYLFTGEEILHSIRFFTHGFDVFIPNENIIFHSYIRNNEPKLWDDIKYENKKIKTIEKLFKVLNSKNNYDANIILNDYGLGYNRTLNEFYNFSNIDIINKKFINNINNINNLHDINNKNNKNDIYNTKNIIIFLLFFSIILLFIFLIKNIF